MSKERPWGKGTPKAVHDASANDSDKNVLTVPAGKYVVVRGMNVQLGTTATVGNRVLSWRVTRGGIVYAFGEAGATQAASLTYHYDIAPGLPLSGVVNASLTMPMHPLVLIAADVLRVWDSAAVDAAADDMTVDLSYVEYDA